MCNIIAGFFNDEYISEVKENDNVLLQWKVF